MSFISTLVKQLFALPGAQKLAETLITEAIWPCLLVLAVLTFVVLICLAPRLYALLRRVPSIVWVDVTLLTALGILLRWWLSPRYPQVYFDEICYVNLARSMSDCGRYCIFFDFPQREQIMPYLPAWPFILAWIQRLGITNPTALGAVCLLGASTAVPLSYALAWQLRMPRYSCAALALLVSSWPLHLRLSASGALESGSFLLFLLLALALMLWHHTDDKAWLWGAGCVWAWFANWRMENPIVLAVLLTAVLMVAYPKFARMWRQPWFYKIAVCALVFSWPGMVCNLYGIYTKFYLTDSTSVRNAAFLTEKIVSNWLFWVKDEFHPLLYTVLAIIALALAWRSRRIWAWVLWFLVLNIFYGFIPTADFALLLTCDSWRNALFPTWGLLVLATLALEPLLNCWHNCPKRASIALMSLFGLAVLAQPFLKNIYIEQRTTWTREFELAELVGRRLPPDAHLFLSGAPWRSQGDSAYIKMWNWASGKEWMWYVLPDICICLEQQTDCPVLFSAGHNWYKDGERTFISIITSYKDNWDDCRLRWFHKYYKLRLVAGEATPYIGESYEVYEIDGLTEAGKKWLADTQRRAEKAEAQQKNAQKTVQQSSAKTASPQSASDSNASPRSADKDGN